MNDKNTDNQNFNSRKNNKASGKKEEMGASNADIKNRNSEKGIGEIDNNFDTDDNNESSTPVSDELITNTGEDIENPLGDADAATR